MMDDSLTTKSSPEPPESARKPPVLRLRGTTKNEELEEEQLDVLRFPDGPWRRHPDEIDDAICALSSSQFPLDMTVENYRIDYQERMAAFTEVIQQWPKSERSGLVKIKHVTVITQLVDMEHMLERSKDDIEDAIERSFVYCDTYLQPGLAWPPSSFERFGREWGCNARGIYYRHYYSPHWSTVDHDLWIPTIEDALFDSPTEQNRRERAKQLLRHTLDNERWNKSEYAWEADVWADVFGQLRNDPALAADKREYYASLPEVHPVSCTLTGKAGFVKRIPDASFGLATFRPKHYQNAVASYALDAERLQALALHRHCGLISDPRCGEADLVFPFAVYEAKGWSGDPREARHQACIAGAAYLDMLDALARTPGPPCVKNRDYQFDGSQNAQTFALTSFGAHWHVMVGYRRPRLKREHAGHPGMSDTVYLYQRIWSGRIADERSAWKLLHLVDQIHEWGVTTFRRYVIRHLHAWHDFSRKVWADDASILRFTLGKDFATCGMTVAFPAPDWAENFGADFKATLQEKSTGLLTKACLEEQPGEPFFRCQVGRCGTENYPGYALFSPEEAIRHHAKVHHEVISEDFVAMVHKFHEVLTVEVEKGFKASHSEAKRKRLLEEYENTKTNKRERRSMKESKDS